jgi:hypothetical protein
MLEYGCPFVVDTIDVAEFRPIEHHAEVVASTIEAGCSRALLVRRFADH